MPQDPPRAHTLPQLVDALKLPATRSAIKKSAHTLTRGDSANAGFKSYECNSNFLRQFEQLKSTRSIATTLARDVLYMKSLSEGPDLGEQFGDLRQKLEPMILTYNEPKDEVKHRADVPDLVNSVWLSLAASQLAAEQSNTKSEQSNAESGQPNTKSRRPRKGGKTNQKQAVIPLVILVDGNKVSKVDRPKGRILFESLSSENVNNITYNHVESFGDGLRLNVNIAAGSELAVQENIGAFVHKCLTVDGCVKTCDEKMAFPGILQMSINHHPHPDLACRAQVPIITKEDGIDPMDMAPVVAAAEAKFEPGSDGPKSPSPESQLQAAVYPTLMILALLFDELHPNDREECGIPDDFIVYGIYYDRSQLKVYAHFPTFTPVEPTEEPQGWRFVQVLMATYDIPKDLNSPMKSSLELAVGLQIVRAQAERLRDVFHKRFTKAWTKIFHLGLEELRNEAVKKAKEKAEEPARLEAEIQTLDSEIDELCDKLEGLKVNRRKAVKSLEIEKDEVKVLEANMIKATLGVEIKSLEQTVSGKIEARTTSEKKLIKLNKKSKRT